MFVDRLNFFIYVERSLERYRSLLQIITAIFIAEEGLKVYMAVLNFLNLEIRQFGRMILFHKHVFSDTVCFVDKDS